MEWTQRTALWALNVAAVFFGMSAILGKLISLAPVTLVFGRGLFALLALGLLMCTVNNARWQPLTWRQLWLLILGGGLLTAHWVTFFMAVKQAGVALATLGFASFPAFTALFESLAFRERIRWPEGALILLICLGLILVCPAFALRQAATVGFVWGIVSGALLALLLLCNRLSVRHVPPLQAALCQNGVIALLTLPAAWRALPAASPTDWGYLLLLGVVCTGVAHGLLVNSLRYVRGRTAAMIFALEPVYAIIFAWLLFNEEPTPRIFAGAALIVCSVAGVARLNDRPTP
ncbi:Putative permease [Sodalis praecaptivus]|uniref:Putative permease n=1 Tax=Sodalis praecaptivus TaxID=1239307 RepID=W0HXG6_9GAMM|nr:DMT family transporter [Sodalis praecaptivus]AHF77212.1 Putative permease [Sodalis praecaptivus]